MNQPVAVDQRDPAEGAAARRLPLGVLVLLGALTAVAPLVTDLYLPALPDLAAALGAQDALGQLTLSVCLVGLALGQLVAGPLSDRIGRVAPLRWGVGLLAVTSFLCAFAPNITVLIVLRLLQGLAGSAALVVTRAIVRDVYSGARAAKVFSELMLVMGLAPVLGPVLGGQLLRFTDWRGIFVVLGVISALLCLAVVLRLEETRPPEARAALAHPLADLAVLLRDRRFLAFFAIGSLAGVILFGYITMSSFVLQDEFGLSVTDYSLVFALNAVGLVIGSQVNARLVVRVGPSALLGSALALALTASCVIAAAMTVDAPLWVSLAALFFVVLALGGTMGNAMALALVPHGDRAGSASALIGAGQFLFGAAVPPLVSIGGATGLRMGLTLAGAAALATATYLAVRARTRG